jgi:formyl-CoA transferase
MQDHGQDDLAAGEAALTGFKVIDLSRVLAGPYCTMILADHGAEVIKIEPPLGDETREWGPPFRPVDGERGDSAYYLGVNRNKRGMALDLSKTESREVLLRLLDGADVLIENFKPGTMEKWGLGYETDLLPRFPKLVHCRISGFGAKGAFAGLPGYDAALQAMTGLMSVNGSAETGPMRIGTPVVDLCTGLYSAIAILMALHERHRSGKGQYLDMTLYDCGMAMLHPQGANFLMSGKRPMPLGNTHSNLAPCDKFTTRTCEIFIAIGNDGQFRKLAEALGRPELGTDPRFKGNAGRMEHRVAMTAELAAAFADKDGEQIAVALLEAGVPVGPVLPIDQVVTREQTRLREMVIEREDFRGIGTPIKLSRTPSKFRRKPPRYAEHNDDILREHGFSVSELDALRDLKIVLDKKKA